MNFEVDWSTWTLDSQQIRSFEPTASGRFSKHVAQKSRWLAGEAICGTMRVSSSLRLTGPNPGRAGEGSHSAFVIYDQPTVAVFFEPPG
jgi:hypothetical protein